MQCFWSNEYFIRIKKCVILICVFTVQPTVLAFMFFCPHWLLFGWNNFFTSSSQPFYIQGPFLRLNTRKLRVSIFYVTQHGINKLVFIQQMVLNTKPDNAARDYMTMLRGPLLLVHFTFGTSVPDVSEICVYYILFQSSSTWPPETSQLSWKLKFYVFSQIQLDRCVNVDLDWSNVTELGVKTSRWWTRMWAYMATF